MKWYKVNVFGYIDDLRLYINTDLEVNAIGKYIREIFPHASTFGYCEYTYDKSYNYSVGVVDPNSTKFLFTAYFQDMCLVKRFFSLIEVWEKQKREENKGSAGMNYYYVKVNSLFGDKLIYVDTELDFKVFEYYMKHIFPYEVYCGRNWCKSDTPNGPIVAVLSGYFKAPFTAYFPMNCYKEVFMKYLKKSAFGKEFKKDAEKWVFRKSKRERIQKSEEEIKNIMWRMDHDAYNLIDSLNKAKDTTFAHIKFALENSDCGDKSDGIDRAFDSYNLMLSNAFNSAVSDSISTKASIKKQIREMK